MARNSVPEVQSEDKSKGRLKKCRECKGRGYLDLVEGFGKICPSCHGIM